MVSVQYIHDRIESGDYAIVQTRSHDMQADIYTKGFNNKGLFQRLRIMIKYYSPEEIEKCILNPVQKSNLGTSSVFPRETTALVSVVG